MAETAKNAKYGVVRLTDGTLRILITPNIQAKLTDLCGECRNYFDIDRQIGTFTIKDGEINADIEEYQFFRVIGSKFNDGIYQKKNLSTDLKHDETFKGAVWTLAIPKAFIDLAVEIDEWENKNADILSGAFSSESFGGYSYSLSSGGNGEGASWQNQFKRKLKRWQKV